MLRIQALDHLVINVADIQRSLDWYAGLLGLTPIRVDEWRRGEASFPSVRVNETTILDICRFDRTGENHEHFCLAVEPADLEAVKSSGRFDVVNGPVPRHGARGWGVSLYVRDPDGNVIELRSYDPSPEGRRSAASALAASNASR
jgi:catechol 2,3-dioxygenase-like lactoylglutathione lyase family enzyme